MGLTAEQAGDDFYWAPPAHEVTLLSYCIGQTEVTQALWQAVMDSNPSYFSSRNNYATNLQRPVESVSWNDCQTFITNLNALTGMNFRLPTEAEWEFAARGGNKSLGNMYAGSNSYDVVAWIKGNAAETTHPVATKAPNELGIYDMSGNIYEYCQDRSTTGTPAYTADPQTNPTGPESGTNCVIRGGSMDYDANLCRCAYRWSDSQSSAWRDQGLRLVLPKE
jgi:formylglycine-generating enzyme required for sulfatase activity